MEELEAHEPDSGLGEVPAPQGSEHHLRSTGQLSPWMSHLCLSISRPWEPAPKTNEVLLAVPLGFGGFVLVQLSGWEWQCDPLCFQLVTSSIHFRNHKKPNLPLVPGLPKALDKLQVLLKPSDKRCKGTLGTSALSWLPMELIFPPDMLYGQLIPHTARTTEAKLLPALHEGQTGHTGKVPCLPSLQQPCATTNVLA